MTPDEHAGTMRAERRAHFVGLYGRAPELAVTVHEVRTACAQGRVVEPEHLLEGRLADPAQQRRKPRLVRLGLVVTFFFSGCGG